jgi:hypothetical protein
MDPISLAKITKLIVHEIPKNYVGGAQRGPVLSDVESPLDQDVRLFFEGRLQQTLGSSFMVEFRPAAPTTKLLTEGYLTKRQDFVGYSQKLANHLFRCKQVLPRLAFSV